MKQLLFCFSLLLPLQLLAQKGGELLDTVTCIQQRNYTYALYIPKSIEKSKAHGLIIFFEPAGRAVLPLTLYREIADRHSLILACSYQAKNGPLENSIKAGYAVLDDLKSKFSVNNIWLSGFSGGARVASLLAIQDKTFAGIIACGAAFQPDSKITNQRAIPFSEIIGNVDMNYIEAVQTIDYLRKIKNPSYLNVFNGGHEWPPIENFSQAVRWQLLNSRILPDDERELFFDRLFTTTKNAYDSGFVYFSYFTLADPTSQMTPQESGKIDSLKNYISTSANYTVDKNAFYKALEMEAKLINDFMVDFDKMIAFAEVDSLFKPSVWSGKRSKIDKIIRSKEKIKSQSGKRIFDFGWRKCIEQYSILIDMKLNRKALMAAKIWNAYEPENAIPSVLIAKAFALQGSTKESIHYLELAVKKGFKRKEYLLQEPAFDAMRNVKGFQKIIEQL